MPSIIIVGAGIIGSATAYYLTVHESFGPDVDITIFEAVEPGAGASGKAGGLLSKKAFPSSIASLSFKLHSELAAKYNGEDQWGYRRVNTVSLVGSDSATAKSSNALPHDLDWIQEEHVEQCDKLGGTDAWGQVHPYQLTNFLANKAQEAGVKLVNAKVTNILYNGTKATGVTYEPVVGSEGTGPYTLEADKIIVTAGPWTGKLIDTAPVSGYKANSITIDPTRQVSPYAIFTELEIDGSYSTPEIYARKNEIYVCGATTDDPIPDTADLVKPDEDKCDRLFEVSGAISPVISGGKVTRKQACYLPVVESRSTSGPFIGLTNVPNLYLAAGHTVWGINNSLATGLLLSEYVYEGQANSAPISNLNPKKYFDASKALTRA